MNRIFLGRLKALLCTLLLALSSLPAGALCRPENRVGGSPVLSSHFASPETANPFEPPQDNPGYGYDFASGVHKYLYCQNDPVDHVDPSGHDIGDILTIMDIFTSFSALIQPSVSTGKQWSLSRLSFVEDSQGKQCVPWVSTYVSNPDNDINLESAIKKLDRVETFERVMTIAALITVNEGLGMEAALEEAGTELGAAGIKVPTGYAEDVVALANRNHGNWGGWYGYTGVARGTKIVPGWFFDGTATKWDWRQVATGGSDDKGRYEDSYRAWKAAAQAAKDRIDSNDL